MICNQANCQLSREEGCRQHRLPDFGKGVQHQIVIHSPEMKTDSLVVCLSGVFNVTDRWVITVSQSWQAVEMKKWRCGTRGWIRGGRTGGGGEGEDVCLLRAIDGSKRKWSENEFCAFPSYFVSEHGAFHANNHIGLSVCTLNMQYFTVIFERLDAFCSCYITSRCTWKFKPITPSNLLNNAFFTFSQIKLSISLQCDIKCNTRNKIFHLLIFLLTSTIYSEHWTQTSSSTVWTYSLHYK